MKLAFTLIVSLLLTSCGYHLVGQGDGKSRVIPDAVTTAALQSVAGKYGKVLLAELRTLWKQHDSFPTLQVSEDNEHHVILRIEGAKTRLTPVAFSAAGLAIQYRLTVSAVLNMYQGHRQIWGSGLVLVEADVFEGNDPSVTEAERERLTEQLNEAWAKKAMARLQSGF